MKISLNSIREGNIIEYKTELWVISKKPEHTKPGKGGAYVQVEMKNLRTGVKINERFSSSDYVEKAVLDTQEYQFLYVDEQKNSVELMDLTTYEQISIDKKNVKDSDLKFLMENMVLTLETYQGKCISVILPSTVILEIVDTSPVIKGATATPSYKSAILSNGVKIMVPSYLTNGEKIVVKVEDASFVERAK